MVCGGTLVGAVPAARPSQPRACGVLDATSRNHERNMEGAAWRPRR